MEMNKKIFIVLTAVLSGIMIGLGIYGLTSGAEYGFYDLAKPGIALLGAFIALGRLLLPSAGSPSKKQATVYAEKYKHIIGDAFSDKKSGAKYSQLMKAIDLYNKNENEKALSILQRLLPKAETNADKFAVLMFTAIIEDEFGEVSAAIESYLAAIKINKASSTAFSNLGLIYRRLGRFHDAVTCFESALETDPRNAYAYTNLGNAYYSLGQFDEAIKNGEKALYHKGDMYQAANLLCLAYFLKGDQANSQKYYERSIANGGDCESLKESLDRLAEVGHIPEAPIPVPDDVKNAMREYTNATSVPFVRLGVPAEHAKSRFGGEGIGKPPLDSDGKPMRLLAAIAFSEMPPLPDFPENGILEFYIAENDSYGADFDDPTAQRNFRVVYTPDESLIEDAYSERGEEDEYDTAFPVAGTYAISPRLDLSPMPPSDYRFDGTVEKYFDGEKTARLDDQTDEIFDLVYSALSAEGHRIGGYPHFTQEDPRAEEKFRKYDTLLLQIDTHDFDDVRIMFGDSGVCNFFIPREKLKARNFSDILYWWDCM